MTRSKAEGGTMTGRAVVWGLGRFGGGLAAFAHLRRCGYQVDVVDKRDAQEIRASLAESGIEAGSVELLAEAPESFAGADLVVVNPAVHPEHPLYRHLINSGVELSQEIDLALSAYPGEVVAVTGTNGKSSTSALLQQLLLASGRDALLGGNIGRSLFEDRESWHSEQIAVLEISSFQAFRLQLAPRLRAVLVTNLDEDHLDWHGSRDQYHAAKLRLSGALQPGGRMLGHSSDPAWRQFCTSEGPGQCLLVGGAGQALRLDPDGAIRLEGKSILAADAPYPSAQPLRENALLALAAAQELGCDISGLGESLAQFQGLEHRMQRLAPAQGVEFIDNGISTVARSSEVAIDSYRSAPGLHWVVGGHPKRPELDEHIGIAASCSSVHIFGEVAERLAPAMRAAHPQLMVTGPHPELNSALVAAFKGAGPGEIVLFSPGFSSHDAYPNFAARAAEAREIWSALRSRTVGANVQ
ncbi:MAG: UDP-N-acetylmuramoyl-L-alanine--D-glutamate ligase [Planctomycetota bacterium]|nr:MAG: UDP-N-acetylmuramoyl-L-alanine--D-glutamate ligase [Planctomycetota bacterium]